ncbi:MAG: hypothetical protein OXE85_07075 [Roseovarius sp.]|nr:hypothetical protein [Roseovarius sp.]
MPGETENHTICMLQEMRQENRKFRQEVRESFERLDRIEAALAGI